MDNNCIILNYHSIFCPNHTTIHIDPIYSIDANSFNQHLELIENLDLNVITIDELFTLKQSNKLSVCLTFDDGHISDHEIVLPLLNKYGFKASFFPTLINFKNNDIRWSFYRSIAENGHTIGSHSRTHKYMSDINSVNQSDELTISKKIIEQKINAPVDYFALPGGKHNKTTIELAKLAGYKNLLTTNFGFIDSKNIPFLLNRWSIKRNTSIHELQNVLTHNSKAINKIKLKNSIKKFITKLIGNSLTDKLNYLIKK